MEASPILMRLVKPPEPAAAISSRETAGVDVPRLFDTLAFTSPACRPYAVQDHEERLTT